MTTLILCDSNFILYDIFEEEELFFFFFFTHLREIIFILVKYECSHIIRDYMDKSGGKFGWIIFFT